MDAERGLDELQRFETGPKTIWLPEAARSLLDQVDRRDENLYVFCGLNRGRTERELNAV